MRDFRFTVKGGFHIGVFPITLGEYRRFIEASNYDGASEADTDYLASIRELEHIVRRMGGNATSPWHLAGLGDLVTTATSKDSHHHELGRMLARGEVDRIQGEGVHTLEMVRRHGLFREEDYPLFELIHSIVSSPGDVQNRLDAYIKQCA